MRVGAFEKFALTLSRMRCTSEETLRSAVSEGVHRILPFRRFTPKTPTHEQLKDPQSKANINCQSAMRLCIIGDMYNPIVMGNEE